MSFNFNLNSIAPSTSNTSSHGPAFNHGDAYPAIIAGLWGATTTYQNLEKKGVFVLVLVSDENGVVWPRGQFVNLGGYVLGSRAAYARMMGGLLRTSAEGEELRQKIEAAGLNDLSALVGKPCLARMTVREKDGRSWASIESLAGETVKSKGLHDIDISGIKPIDIDRVSGKFIDIPDLKDCTVMAGLQTVSQEGDLSAIIRDDASDAIF